MMNPPVDGGTAEVAAWHLVVMPLCIKNPSIPIPPSKSKSLCLTHVHDLFLRTLNSVECVLARPR